MSNVLTSQQILDQAFGSNNIPQAEVNQALGNNTQKPSKAIGVQVSVITLTRDDPNLYLGSAFNIDVGFLEPMNYDKGLPKQNGDSKKAQVFHLSVQRRYEEYTLMREIADEMLTSSRAEFTLNWAELDAEKYPFTVALWAKSGMVWHFVNRKVAKPGGDKITADKVSEVLAQIL